MNPLKKAYCRTFQQIFHIALTIYDETVPNPTTVNVEDARALYLKYNCSALIGFGGGSSFCIGSLW